MLRFSRPESNEEVFQISGSEENVVELVKTVARMLPHNIDWEIKNGSILRTYTRGVGPAI